MFHFNMLTVFTGADGVFTSNSLRAICKICGTNIFLIPSLFKSVAYLLDLHWHHPIAPIYVYAFLKQQSVRIYPMQISIQVIVYSEWSFHVIRSAWHRDVTATHLWSENWTFAVSAVTVRPNNLEPFNMH